MRNLALFLFILSLLKLNGQTPAPNPADASALASMQQQVTQLNTTITALQTQIKQNASASDVSTLKTQLDAAQASLKTVSDSLSALQTQVAQAVANVPDQVTSTLNKAQAEAVAQIEAIAKKYNSDNDAYDERPDQFEVRRSIMDPKEVSDIFGRRIGQRYLAFQVTVINRRSDLQLRIQDLSLDLCEMFVEEAKLEAKSSPSLDELKTLTDQVNDLLTQGFCVASSQELTLLRGVAEKGQSLDPRNLTLHSLQGAASILGAIAPASAAAGANLVASATFAKAVSVFAGPGLAAYAAVFPDFSVTQTQRLSDSAYNANTIVPQGQSKVVVVFLPQSVLFTREDRKNFWKDPNGFIRGEFLCNDQKCPPALVKIRAHVKAQFIVDLSDTPPALAPKAVSLTPSEQAGLFTVGATVHGTLVGNYLGGATLSIVSTNKDDFTLTTTKVTDGEIDFTIQPKKADTSPLMLTFSVTKAKATVTQDLVVTK